MPHLVTAPQPLPIPKGVKAILPNTEVTMKPDGAPLYLSFTATTGTGLLGWLGQNVTFKVSSASPCNLSIYGPNPTQLGPPFGRMRAPKVGQPDASTSQCEGNFKPGIYYLAIRKGDNGPPVAPVTISITTQGWQIFG